MSWNPKVYTDGRVIMGGCVVSGWQRSVGLVLAYAVYFVLVPFVTVGLVAVLVSGLVLECLRWVRPVRIWENCTQPLRKSEQG